MEQTPLLVVTGETLTAQNAAAIYLAGLAPGSQRTMR